MGSSTALGVYFIVILFSSSFACEEFKHSLSNHIGIVTSCFSVHMSPSSLCGWCLQPLRDLQMVISNQSARSPSGSLCIDIVKSTDKAALSLLQFTADIWNRSFCQHCLEPLSNIEEPILISDPFFGPIHVGLTTISPKRPPRDDQYNLAVYNNDTVRFFDKLTKTLECFTRHIENKTVSLLDTLSFPDPRTLRINKSVCVSCEQDYTDLLTFYQEKLVRYNVERGEFRVIEYDKYTNSRFAVCSDVQYALNRTQWAWSRLLGCHLPENFTPHILLPLGLCLLTILMFHILICTLLRDPIRVLIYQPKRVAPVLRSTSRHSSTPIWSRTPSYGAIASDSQEQSSSHTGIRVTRTHRL